MTFIYKSFKETSPVSGSERTQESFNRSTGSATATRFFVGNWIDRLDFVFEYLFSTVSSTPTSTSFLKPKEYPDLKGLYVNDIKINGEGTATWDDIEKKSIWERARVTVEYDRFTSESDNSDQDEDSYKDYIYISENIDSHVEKLTIDRHDIVTRNGDAILGLAAGAVLGEGADHGVTIATATIILNKNGVITPPWELAGRLLGAVNLTTFITPSGFICPPKTLRFDGPTGNTKVNIMDGGGLINEDAFPLPVWDFSLKFEFNRKGWNNKFHRGRFIDALVNGKPFHDVLDLWPLVFGKAPNAEFTNNLDIIANANEIIDNFLEEGLTLESDAIQIQLQRIRNAKSDLGFRV